MTYTEFKETYEAMLRAYLQLGYGTPEARQAADALAQFEEDHLEFAHRYEDELPAVAATALI